MPPIDSSIYANVQVPAVNLPSPIDAAEKGMRLSALGMQQAQLGYQMHTQAAVRTAFEKNTDPQSGQVNRAGFLSDLGKTAPMVANDYQTQFAQQDKQSAEAQTAQMQAAHQTLSVTTPALQYLLSLPNDQAAKAYPNVMAQLKSQGVAMNNAPPQWDRGWAQQGYSIGSKMKEGLDNQSVAANVGKVPAEINASLYGSRSPNAELTSQYDKQVQPLRNSQVMMNQMLKNYESPSPQGDASLIVNAYKIKYPNAPDVGSLKEMATSQSVPDQFRQWAAQKLAGGMDAETRKNIMRDVGPVFQSNVESLGGVQQRFKERQKIQNVNDPTLTYEPAIEKTSGKVNALLGEIGPYVPNTERGGIMGAITKGASKIAGVGGNQSAKASLPVVKLGTVEDGYVFMGGDPGKKSSWKAK